jgi:hypothetical protein
MANMNLNQFKQVPVEGTLDLSLMKSGVISGVISVNQATALNPGARVKLDTTAQVFVPSFVAAAYNAFADGILIFTSKGSSMEAETACEVAMDTIGPIMWLEAAAAITAGVVVEAVTGVRTVQTYSAGKKVGVALDGAAAAGDLIRVIMNSLATKA